MLISFAVLALVTTDLQPAGMTLARPEAPLTQAQREQQAQDRANQVTEGERSGDGATPQRLVCDYRRMPGSNIRQRVCSTVADRRATRDEARETIQSMQGSRTDPVG
jgi:hypothetical protein